MRAARIYIAASLICDNDQERRIDVAGIRTLLSISIPEESNKLTNHLAMTGTTALPAVFFHPRLLRFVCSGFAGDGVQLVTATRYTGVCSSVPRSRVMAVAAGERVASGRWMLGALRAADALRGPTLIAIVVDKQEFVRTLLARVQSKISNALLYFQVRFGTRRLSLERDSIAQFNIKNTHSE